MKKILDKAGLLMIALGAAVIVVFFLVISFISGFSIYLLALVLPAVFFIFITLKDRLVGGLLTTVISAFLLVPVSIGLSSSESTPVSFGLFAILICLLLGGVSILVSLAIRSPRNTKARA
jgi:membrane-bound ClpP family serine protease